MVLHHLLTAWNLGSGSLQQGLPVTMLLNFWKSTINDVSPEISASSKKKERKYLYQICCDHSGTSGASSFTMHVDTMAQRLVLKCKLDSSVEVGQRGDPSHVDRAEPQLLHSYSLPLLKPGPPVQNRMKETWCGWHEEGLPRDREISGFTTMWIYSF